MSDFSGKNILIVGGNVVMFSTVAVCIGLAFHA